MHFGRFCARFFIVSHAYGETAPRGFAKHVCVNILPISGSSVRARLIRGPDPVDFDDFGENSTISPFRFNGLARSLHENARVNGIHADVWSIGQGQARGHPTNLDFA